MKRVFTSALLGLALTGAAAYAADEQTTDLKAPEAAIPFANMQSSIRDWEADGVEGIWVQDARRQWYYGKLIGPCHGLDFAVRVGFEVRGNNSLDRFGTVVVPDHGRCALQSFTKSEGPPERKRQGGDAKPD